MTGQDWISSLRSHWSSLDGDWAKAQDRWHDGTTALFARMYWEQLEQETRALEPAAQQLLDALDTARRVAQTR
jgi:hypothetical protein